VKLKSYYVAEEEIPAENSISGKSFWTALEGGLWSEGRLDMALAVVGRLRNQGRKVRLVRVTREEVSVTTTHD
jgi:hypothetical protein